MTENRILEFGTLTPETLNTFIARSGKDRRDLTIDRRKITIERRGATENRIDDYLEPGILTPETLNAYIARSGKDRRNLTIDRRGLATSLSDEAKNL